MKIRKLNFMVICMNHKKYYSYLFWSTKRQREMNINDLTNISWGNFRFNVLWEEGERKMINRKSFSRNLKISWFYFDYYNLYFLIIILLNLSPNKMNKNSTSIFMKGSSTFSSPPSFKIFIDFPLSLTACYFF